MPPRATGSVLEWCHWLRMSVIKGRADTKRDALRGHRVRSPHRAARLLVAVRGHRRRTRARYALARGVAVVAPREAVPPVRRRDPRWRRRRRHRPDESGRAAGSLGRVSALARCARRPRAPQFLHAVRRHELLGAPRRARCRARRVVRPGDDRGTRRRLQARPAPVPRGARCAHAAPQARAVRRGVGARRRRCVARGHGRVLGEPRTRAAADRREGDPRGRGPPRTSRRAGGVAIPIGRDAIVLRDDGLPADPHTDLEWLDWVAAGETRNWCRNDLLVDWLAEYGGVHGFVPDRQLEGFTEAFDLGRFLMHQGRAFERALIADLASRFEVVRVATRPDEARSLRAATATWDA